MFSVMEQFSQMAKTNTERGLRCATISFERAERLFKMQTDVSVSMLEEGSKSMTTLLQNEGDFSKVLSEWPNFYEANVQRMLDITRSFFEITSQTQSELTQLIDESVGEFAKVATEQIEALTKAAEPPLPPAKPAAARAGAVDIETAAKKVKARA